MKKSVCIDWLSFTAPYAHDMVFPRLPEWEQGERPCVDTPRFGYRQAHKYPSGMVVMWDGATATMGQHYIYSGSAIKLLDELFHDGGMTILKWHMEHGHKCTRIDLAVDVTDDDRIMPEIEQLAASHSWSGTAHSSTTVKSNDAKGSTVYVGSRTSERFVRIYDKAAQTGQSGHWTRIECEIKGDSARAVARAIVGFGEAGLSMLATGVITRVCNFPSQSWMRVFDGEKMAVGTPKVEEKHTEQWILGQVASAVARFEREYPEKKILERLWNAIEDRLGE